MFTGKQARALFGTRFGKKLPATKKRKVSYLTPDPMPSIGHPGRLPVLIPVRTVSEANTHEHWRRRNDRASQQRSITAAMLTTVTERPALPCTLRLTRLTSATKLMDSDNAIGSMKHVRDSVAEWLGVDDGPSGPVTWDYGPQERAKYYAVRVEVVTAAKESA